MKIIFLDIDGVLNNYDILAKADAQPDTIDPVMVSRVNKIVEATGAKIVLSSTWRIMFGLEQTVNAYLIPAGLKGEVIDATPHLHRTAWGATITRGKEIALWLAMNPGVERFVILDDLDEDEMGNLSSHLIKTTFYVDGGLQDRHVGEAIALLT